MEDLQANPDTIHQRTHEDTVSGERGKLKIFFGYAAGAGKTYAMLKAAQNAKRSGVDVVAGYVEPHARPDTTALLARVEQLPFFMLEHKGIKIREFDLDAAIRRHPKLILVDELAHTNGEGCRHAKRYQDVEELLTAGIDVYATVNVQHLESLNDIVASITGVLVQERIPDKVFDSAAQVELVDIEPAELLERLRGGKIYREPQAEQALSNFFTAENLAALREIALRRCADRVNKLSEKGRKTQGGYPADEHILVCLSASPSNGKIIRTAARMANAFKGTFTALFVETPSFQRISEHDKSRLRENINLAQQLGASIETVYGEDISVQIAEFARFSGVTKIVAGRSSTGRRGLFRTPSMTERLTAAAPNLDIYIIPDEEVASYRPPRAKTELPRLSPRDICISIGILLAATVIGFGFYRLGFSESNIITIYILGVLVTAVTTSHPIYSLVSSVISVLTFNFFFTVPRFTLEAYGRGYPVTFLIMFAAAFLTSTLAVKMKQSAHRFAHTAHRTKILLDTNQLLQKATDTKGVISVTAGQLTRLLQRDIVFYPAKPDGLGEPEVFMAGEAAVSTNYISKDEKAVAAWAFQNNKRAGAGTSTLGSAQCLYLAVRVNETVYGVVGIAMGEGSMDTFENSIMLSILGECALALENQRALREREEAAVLARNEQLRANLLRSISHDLRTPLTAISGSAGILLSKGSALEEEKRQELYGDIYDDSLWLINLVENLLSVTRIEDGTMKLRLTAELLEEVVTEALSHVKHRRSTHKVILDPSQEFLLAKMDARLIVQVLINLVDNAIKYTPDESEIHLRMEQQGEFAVVSVADSGPGIPDEAKAKIFDLFYTVGTTAVGKIAIDSRRSLGLGLTLCKSIINAHGGEISVTDNKPHGAIFTFTLPLAEVTLHE